MSKQTSVEWLIECLNIHLTEEQKTQFEGLFQQSKQMHKEEMINLLQWMNKVAETNPMQLETDHDDIVEQYYQETYGGNNES
jgi:hypothetical protein